MKIRIVFLIAATTLLSNLLYAQSFWQTTNESEFNLNINRDIVPQKYLTYSLQLQVLKEKMSTAPMEFTAEARQHPLVISLPMPNGTFQRFKMVKSPIMEEGLAVQFPNIVTYSGQGIDDPYAVIKTDFTDWGFHGMILSPNGVVFIDPYSKANTTDYIVYYKHDYYNAAKANFQELPPIKDPDYVTPKSTNSGICIGSQLRKYRLAVACTGEYAQAVCGGTATVAATLSAITTSVNRVDGVYETEVAIRLVLVANESSVVFTNPSSDPFTGNNNSGTLIGESQTVITSNIGTANFDIGHTFSTGGGGLANLGCVCKSTSKAKGITGSSNPVGDPYDIDYVAHEMGHEFGGDHPFNSSAGSCGGGNRTASAAYEVGSGVSIMAYAGICNGDDIQPHSDPYFHTYSFDQIVTYSNTGTGNSCPVLINTGNNPPSITMPTSGLHIPKSTPFVLTGSGSDPDGDALTYSWEEFDKGASTTWDGGAATTSSPIFKSRIPKTTGTRYFPSLAIINAGYPTAPTATMDGLKGEILPTVSRTLNFRLTVRDNKNGGGGVATGGNGCSSTAPFTVFVDGSAGPFKENVPNGGEVWTGGTPQTVTWNVANTTNSTVNCQFVNIYMSVDGGLSYPTLIASHVPNNGTLAINAPNIATSVTVRFMIKCEDNLFFDVSDQNFIIQNNPDLPLFGGITEVKNEIKVEVVPNPATDEISFVVDGASNTQLHYEIVNVLGASLMQGSIDTNLAAQNDKIGIGALPAGLYIVRISNKEKLTTVRFIKK